MDTVSPTVTTCDDYEDHFSKNWCPTLNLHFTCEGASPKVKLRQLITSGLKIPWRAQRLAEIFWFANSKSTFPILALDLHITSRLRRALAIHGVGVLWPGILSPVGPAVMELSLPTQGVQVPNQKKKRQVWLDVNLVFTKWPTYHWPIIHHK